MIPNTLYDRMCKWGLPHYDSSVHCWCKPTVIALAMSREADPLLLIFHNYGTPLTDREIHNMFLYACAADILFDNDQDDNDDDEFQGT